MPSDRSYLRDDYERENTSSLTWLLCALVAGFAVQFLLGSPWLGGRGEVEEFLTLGYDTVSRGWLWTLLTYPFLHSTSFLFHLVGNALALYFLGRELLPLLGALRFYGILGVASLAGGLMWLAVHHTAGAGETLCGATPAVFALLTVFACLYPRQPLQFLLFFVFPVTVTPRQVALGLGAVVLAGFAAEVFASPLPFGVTLASSAHLGGIVTGLVYFRFIHHGRWALGSPDRPEAELPRWLAPKKRESLAAAPIPELAPAPRVDLRAEADRILDKINSHGLASLTAEEKRLLAEARDLLSGR